ncbi:hypothetical protein [Natronocalculus amylovorans]|uniref:Uncharacterized protein n=1 Tax=Natronocalculus amylovorans TaxID=2917812 RepID=A0AAE3KAI9_9EURY|nr:hypothetical protein [Natronocalculus amylovorans]MCL9818350.1 hypothetical protein [Natronocalculus amylovorans]
MSDRLGDEIELADANEVDRDPVLSLSECPECGPNTLATVRVEDAIYIASCSSCDHEVRAPVVIKDGTEVVAFQEPVPEENTL